MIRVVTNSEMRELDNLAIKNYGIPGIVLMENAGRNSAEIIINKCRDLEIESVLIFTGKGNNGGDGFVVARYLHNFGLNVQIYLLAEAKDLSGDAKTNFEICSNSSIDIQHVKKINQITRPKSSFLIVDALLGTGVKGAVQDFYAEVINWINDQTVFVCSMDIPSGLSGDSAEVPGPAVSADLTCTMGLPKISSFFYPARSFFGDQQQIDIGFPARLEYDTASGISAVSEDDIFFRDPDPSLHKHKAGRVFILGGSTGMTGALVLSAKAATIAGAGLVITGIAESLNPVLENKLTEQLSIPLPENENGILGSESLENIREKIDWCHTFLAGPGAGRHKKTLSVLKNSIEYSLKQNKKIIIDADALFLLATEKKLLSQLNENCIITPHHGEFARLKTTDKNVLKFQPWKVLQEFMNNYNFVTNLKGAPSIVGHKNQGLFINTSGNPGLAKGGSGDILAGLIAGLCASGFEPLSASVYSNYIHGVAADNAAEKWGIRSFSMENLLDEIKLVFKNLY